jgi:hypothetical protein
LFNSVFSSLLWLFDNIFSLKYFSTRAATSTPQYFVSSSAACSWAMENSKSPGSRLLPKTLPKAMHSASDK